MQTHRLILVRGLSDLMNSSIVEGLLTASIADTSYELTKEDSLEAVERDLVNGLDVVVSEDCLRLVELDRYIFLSERLNTPIVVLVSKGRKPVGWEELPKHPFDKDFKQEDQIDTQAIAQYL